MTIYRYHSQDERQAIAEGSFQVVQKTIKEGRQSIRQLRYEPT